MTPHLSWQKSSYCGNAACVEVAQTESAVLVRDSKRPDAKPISVGGDAWAAFLEGVRAGEFG